MSKKILIKTKKGRNWFNKELKKQDLEWEKNHRIMIVECEKSSFRRGVKFGQLLKELEAYGYKMEDNGCITKKEI